MEYTEALTKMKKQHICPFCNEEKYDMIEENNLMYVIPARAPYVEDHLLIVPKRHVVFLQELNHQEIISLHTLVEQRTNKLHTQHEAVNLLLRDSLANKKSEKSINHLHFHLIPDCPIWEKTGKSEPNRKFFSAKEYKKITKNIKEKYN